MKKSISILLAFLLLLPVAITGAAQEEHTVSMNQLLDVDVDDIYGVSLFPYLQEQKTDDTAAIRQFAKELLAFELVPLDENRDMPSLGNPGKGTFIEFYDQDGKRIDGLFFQNGYIERGYQPVMSRMPMFTHRLRDADAFSDWLNGYTSLWGTGQEQGKSDDILSSAKTPADALYQLGLFKGSENGYALEQPVTRAEAITMVLRMIGEEEWVKLSSGFLTFDDVDSSHWAYNNIGYAAYKKYINGTSETTFEPERDVTGKEFVKMLLNAMGYQGITIHNPYEEGKAYGLLKEDRTGIAVSSDSRLLRSDVVNICYNALNAKIADGMILKDLLVNKGIISKESLVALTDNKPSTGSFTWNLNNMMPKDKNYMFSPLSIKMAFAMAANGAEEATKDEILKTLGIDDLGQFNESAAQLIKEYSENEYVKLNIANAIWLNTDYYKGLDVDFTNIYKDIVLKYYDAKSGNVNNNNAVDTINSWVKDKTNDKIKNLINDNDFLACLVNAIYFKGEWATPFTAEATQKAEFTDRNDEKTDIDFMHRVGFMKYYADDQVQMVKLPYKDGKTNMYVALPASRDINLEQYIGKMELKNVQFNLPKFKVEYKTELQDILPQLGIQTAFDKEKADFQQMFTETPDNVYINKVIHKAYINVDEKGAEAAASSAILMPPGGMPQKTETVTFNANRPFTYFIRDDQNGEIMFIGEYAYAK